MRVLCLILRLDSVQLELFKNEKPKNPKGLSTDSAIQIIGEYLPKQSDCLRLTYTQKSSNPTLHVCFRDMFCPQNSQSLLYPIKLQNQPGYRARTTMSGWQVHVMSGLSSVPAIIRYKSESQTTTVNLALVRSLPSVHP